MTQIHYCLMRALAYIEDHLSDDISLEELADTANYSPWHFHRLFTAYIGYGVGEYVRRRRLSEASRELVFCEHPIRDIAHKYRFESQAAFTRALKAYCGKTPGVLRTSKGPLIRFSPINFTQSIKHYRKGAMMQNPRILHRNACQVVGLAGQFTMENNSIPQLWDEFNKRDKEIPHANHDAAIGICFHDDDYQAGKPFTYMAAFAVTDISEIPLGMVSHQIQAGEYAVFEHVGALDTLNQTYDMIYREWLPSSEYEMDKRDDLEIYDERFVYGAPESVMEIWIPVRKR